MTDPRIEAAARAIYADVNKGHSRDKGWDEVRAHWQEDYRSNARAALAAADKAAAITTVEGLDALPVGTVILDGDPAVLQMVEKSEIAGSEWAMANETYLFTRGKITLPARVIHWGTE